MDYGTYFRFFLALLGTLVLIWVLAWAFRTWVQGRAWGGVRPTRRLSVVEVTAIDSRRRLILVRRDDREHLLLLGSASELVVESDIVPPVTDEDIADTNQTSTTATSLQKRPGSFRETLERE